MPIFLSGYFSERPRAKFSRQLPPIYNQPLTARDSPIMDCIPITAPPTPIAGAYTDAPRQIHAPESQAERAFKFLCRCATVTAAKLGVTR